MAEGGSCVLICEICKESFRVSPSRRHARFCGQSCSTIARRGGLVKNQPRRGTPWTPEEIEILEQYYRAEGPDRIAKRLPKRTKPSIKGKAIRLGFGAGPTHWTQEEEEWLRDNYARYRLETVAKKLKKSVGAVRAKANRISVTREDREFWTMQDVGMIFGVSNDTVLRWVRKGWLRAQKRDDHRGGSAYGGIWDIKPKDVRDFVIGHPIVFDIRKVDQLSFIDLVAGKGITS